MRKIKILRLSMEVILAAMAGPRGRAGGTGVSAPRARPAEREPRLCRASTGSPLWPWQKPPPPHSRGGAGAGPARSAPQGPCSVFIDFISFLFLPAEPAAAPWPGGGPRCAALSSRAGVTPAIMAADLQPHSPWVGLSVWDGHTARPASTGSEVLAAASAPCRHRAGWGACSGEWGAGCTGCMAHSVGCTVRGVGCTVWGAASAAQCMVCDAGAVEHSAPCTVCGAQRGVQSAPCV